MIHIAETFYISDLHFGHQNILAFDNRAFKTIQEHDEALISRWNNAVGIEDDVWVLGDISWHGPVRTAEIFRSLNGTKHLVIGNHDYKLLKNQEVRSCFCEIVDYREIMDSNHTVILCHYPIPCYNKHFYGAIHLYGHVHNSFEWNMMQRVQYEMRELYGKPCRMYNIGCMIPYMDYTPRTLQEILDTAEGSK